MTLLDQLEADVPDRYHQITVYWTGDLAEAERIAGQVRELSLKSVRYVLSLARFEPRPPDGHVKRAAYDVLIAALGEVLPILSQRPPIEGGSFT